MSGGTEATTVLVRVGDVAVRCTLSGTDREGIDPVVLLPGIGGTTETEFSFLLPLLARTGRVLAVDLQYATATPATLASVAGQLAAVLRQLLPTRRITLVGFSVGASVATAITATSTEVASLVVVAPVLRASNRHRLAAALRARLLAGDPDAVRSLDLFAAHSAAFLQVRIPDPLSVHEDRDTDGDADISAKHHLFANADLAEFVSSVTVPTLVVGATHDDLSGIEQARVVFASLPNARYAEIDSGHAVLAERPAEVLALIREFAAHPLRHRPGSVLEAARP